MILIHAGDTYYTRHSHCHLIGLLVQMHVPLSLSMLPASSVHNAGIPNCVRTLLSFMRCFS